MVSSSTRVEATSVTLKIQRAATVSTVLAETMNTWASSNPISARCELREERLGFRLILDPFPEEPPLAEWRLILGECVHNLRTALDNMAFALASLQRDPPKRPRDIAFPIYESREAFEREGRRKIDQMMPVAAEMITRVQPFQRDGSTQFGNPEDDLLLVLQRLSNTDKHQVPPLVVLAPLSIEHSCCIEFASEADADANVPPDATVWSGPLSAGVTLLEHRTTRPVVKVYGRYDGVGIIAIDDRGRRPVADLAVAMTNYVALVCSQFYDMFGHDGAGGS